MKILALSFALAMALASLAAAQNTPVFPGRVATTQDLLVASNLYSSNLSVAMAATDTAIAVYSVAGLTAPTAVSIGNEIIQICSISGLVLNICAGGRGFDNTVAATAPVLTIVSALENAWYHNQTAAEVIALESVPHFAVITSAGQLPGSCAAAQMWLLTPGGTFYTCQNGIPGVAGSGGGPTTVSWSALTSSQWSALTSAQWSALTP